MNPFLDPEKTSSRTLAPGVGAAIAWGEKLMLSLVTLEPGAVVGTHSHPHEQMGLVVSGTMELTVGEQTRLLSANDMYLVPGGVPHSAKGGRDGAVALDAFSPPREEYR
ncbi:MAG: cupin domain-containing protein [Verrucomicrobiota bacterium]